LTNKIRESTALEAIRITQRKKFSAVGKEKKKLLTKKKGKIL